MASSPFTRSSLVSRSPPPERRAPASVPTSPAPADLIPTPDLQTWMSHIEKSINDICTIANEGKLNSEQKLKISSLGRNVCVNVGQLALQYQSLKQKNITAHTHINALTEQLNLSEQLRDLKQSLKTAPFSTIQPNLSFAETVKLKNNSVVRPPIMSSIAIYPKNKDDSSEVTKNRIQSLVKPEELKLHVRGLRKTKNGGVIISTERKDDLEKLKNLEQLKQSGLKIEETTKKRPKIILLGVPSNTTEKDLIECLYEQNISDKHPSITREQLLSSIKLSHKSGRRDMASCNYIVELTAALRKILIQQERVFIHWTSCAVRDFTLVTRCYNCQQYGHSAKYCKDPKPTCGHCACEGHTIKECTKKADPEKCASCHRFNKPSGHKTGDENCPSRKISEARYMSSVDYEGA